MQDFSINFPYLDISELIQYYGVFQGYTDIKQLHKYDNLIKNIEINIINKFDELKEYFIFNADKKTQNNIENFLFQVSIGNRKFSSSNPVYLDLLHKNIIKIEHTREKPLRINPNQQIKKEFRNYQIEDKVQFTKGFYRFWFNFIVPYKDDIKKQKYINIVQNIENEMNKYISLSFEKLSNDLLIYDLGKQNIVESGSYWDKHVELDILMRLKNKTVIVGEVKYKNQKVSKNTLNKLKKKSIKANINANYYALFSKSGFSNELINNRDKNVLLYDIQSFKRLLNEK